MRFNRRAKAPTTASSDATPKTKPAPKPPKAFVFHTITPEELVPDGTVLCTFTILGRPATKKTHQDVIFVRGSPRIIPSKQYNAYEKLCKATCDAAWVGQGKCPMDYGISIQMRIWLNNWSVGDATGYQQAIGDIIQKYGVIANDSWLHWTDGIGEHWLGGIDKDNPRTELVITRLRHPKELYRAEQEAEELRKQQRKIDRELKATSSNHVNV